MDEFLINRTTQGSQSLPSTTGFRGTQFVVVWTDFGDNTIKGQMLGLNGSKTSDEFLVNLPTPPGPRRRLPSIIEWSRGLAVAWIEQAPGSTGPAHVKLRTLDEDTMSGDEIQVSSTEVDPQVRPALAPLADKGFVVVWADKRDSQRIRGQRFDIGGARNGPEFRANTVPGLHREPAVSSLARGNIVVAWRARTAPLRPHLQIFDAKGPVGTEQTAPLDVTDITMTALDSGRFVIAFVRNAGDMEPGFETSIVQAKIFEANGAPTNRQFAVTAPQRIVSRWPTLAPLSGGRFLVAWTQVDVDKPMLGTHVAARIVSETKGPLGQAVRVNTSTEGERSALCAATTSDPESGEVACFAWADDRTTAGDVSGGGVRGRLLPVPASGF